MDARATYDLANSALTEAFRISQPANLFNKSDTGTSVGFYVNSNNGTLVAGATYYTSHRIDVTPGEKYTIRLAESSFGGFYFSNGSFHSKIGNSGGVTTPFTFTVPSGAVYMRVCGKTSNIETDMIVRGTTYPSVNVPFGRYLGSDIQLSLSPMFKKIVSFNGDSICFGAGYAGGYGKIIADRNGMVYENIAVSGATIASGTTFAGDGSPRHSVSQTIGNMRSDADYVILEGGVNDKSLTTVPLGTMTSTMTGPFDHTTFIGAMEYMFSQAVARFPGKKIGFILVHRLWDLTDTFEVNWYPAIVSVCKKWGVPLCDIYKNVPSLNLIASLKTAYTNASDGWHPNEAGYRQFYVDKIEAWMKRL